MALRRAVLALLDLPTEHFLRLQAPLPSALLAAAAVVLLPDARAHQLFDRLTRVSTASSDPPGLEGATLEPPQREIDTVSTEGTIGVSSCRPDEQLQVQTPGGGTEEKGRLGGLVPLSGSALSDGRAALLGGPQEQLLMLRMVRSQLIAKVAELGGAPPFSH